MSKLNVPLSSFQFIYSDSCCTGLKECDLDRQLNRLNALSQEFVYSTRDVSSLYFYGLRVDRVRRSPGVAQGIGIVGVSSIPLAEAGLGASLEAFMFHRDWTRIM